MSEHNFSFHNFGNKGGKEKMKIKNGKFNSLKLISFEFSQEMARKNLLAPWESYLSPEIVKELHSICEEFDIKPHAAGTKSGSQNPSNGEWMDYLLFEMVFRKSAPCLTQMVSEIAEKMPLDGEASRTYNGYYFITSNYQYARILPSGHLLMDQNKIITAREDFLIKGETLGQSLKEEDLSYVGFNYESRITFRTVLHEIIHIKIHKDEDRVYPESEEWFDEAVEKIGGKMRLPLDKSIWHWSGIKEEHELLGKAFKHLAEKIGSNLERWDVNPKLPN